MLSPGPCSPRSNVEEDDATLCSPCEAMISFAPSEAQIVMFAQSLRRQLIVSGVPCTMPLTSEVGGVRWRRELVKLLKRTAVFVCLISEEWLRSGEELLALYYALRRSFVCSTPVVVPIILPNASPNHPVVKAVTQQCFHIIHKPENTIPELVVKLRNFLKALQYEVSDMTPHDGVSLGRIYAHHYALLTGKTPKRAIVGLLEGMTDRSTVLDLSTNMSATPPRAFYLGDTGVKPLLEVLKVMPNLEKLVLRGNGLTNAVMHGLIGALISHPAIKHIDLSDNDISQAGAAELYYLIRNNEQITELLLDNTSIHSPVWLKRIRAQLDRNKGSVFNDWSLKYTATNLTLSPLPPLDPVACMLWDVVVTCRPSATLATPSLWTVDNIEVDVACIVSNKEGLVLKHSMSLGAEEMAEVLAYYQEIDRNTCCIKKINGATLKLVLENSNAGLEAIQQVCRRMVCKDAGWDVSTMRGLQKVAARAACEKPKRSAASSFFIDCELWYKDDVKLSKSVPQLFKEDIIRYTGNVMHEVLTLMDRIYDQDMVLEEERQALEDLEDEEDRVMQEAEDEAAERVISYWKTNTQLFKQKLDASVVEKLKSRKRQKENQGFLEKTATEDTLAVKLQTIDDRYAKSCLQTVTLPPYLY